MAGKNGREVGRVSLRVLPNMDHFRKRVEQQAKGMRPLNVDVEADTGHFEKELQRKTRNRRTTISVVADTKHFFNHLKKATNLAPSVKVAIQAVPTNFKLPKVPDLELKVDDSAALKQLDQFSKKVTAASSKWKISTPALGVTGSVPKVPSPGINKAFSEDDFKKPLAILHEIHTLLAKQVRARMLDDLHKGLDTATTKVGDVRKAFRMVYAYKFKPRYVDPFTEPFAKGAANARKFINDVRQEFNEGVDDMRNSLKKGLDNQRVRIKSAVQAPQDRKELKARKPDLEGYKKELDFLEKILKARQLQSVIANKRGQKTGGYAKPLAEVQKLLALTKNLSDTDIIGRKAVQKALSDLKKIDKGIVGLNTKLISGELPEAPSPSKNKGKKNTLSPEIDLGNLRAFEKEYTTAFQKVARKARGEFNRVHNILGGLTDQAKGLTRQISQSTARVGGKVVKPVKDKVSTQVNKIKDVWDSSTAKRYRKAWTAVGKDTGNSLRKGMSKGFAYARKESTNLDGSLGKLRKRLDGYRASKDIFGFGSMMKQLGFADKKVQKFAKRTTLGLTRMGWIATAVGSLAAPAIGLIGGALAALPALGAAGIAAISLVALGMDGIKEAAQAAAPQFNNLKSSISDIYAEGLVSQFEQLGGVIEKTQPAMEGVARATMVAGQGITNAVSSSRGVDLLNKTLDNTAGLFGNLQPFTEGFTMGLLELAGAGSETFEGLSDSLNSFGQDFETSMREMSESGALQDAISSTFEILGSIGTNLGTILGAAMAELPSMVEPLTTLLDGIGNGLAGLMPILATMTNGLAIFVGNLAAELGNIGQAIAPGFEAGFMGLSAIATGAVTGISSIIQSVAPLFNGLMEGLAPHMESIGGSLSSLGSGFATAFEPFAGPLGDTIQNIADAIGGPLASGFELLSQYGPVIAESLGTALTNAGPGIESLVEALAPLMEGNFEILAGVLTGFLQTLPAIGEVVGTVADAIARFVESPLAQTIMEWIQAVLQFLAPIYGVIGGLLMFWAGIMKVISIGKLMFTTLTMLKIPLQILFGLFRTNPIGILITAIALLIGWLINFFTNTEKGREMWAKFTSFLSSAWESAKTAVVNGIQAIGDWWSNTVESISNAWDTAVMFIQTVFFAVKEAIVNKFNEIKEAWSNALQRIKDAVTSIDLAASGRALIQGFINGIRSMIGAVGDAAKAVVQKARDFFPFSPARTGPFSGKGWVLYSGRSIGQAFAQGMLDEEHTVAGAAKSLAKAASVPFENPSKSMEEYHRNTIRQATLENNAQKIAEAREKEAEEEKKAAEKIAEIRKSDAKQAKKDEQIAKVRADLAKKNADRQKELQDSLEVPDYSQINRSFESYWIDGLKSATKDALMDAVDSFGLIEKTKSSVRQAVKAARREFGNHPIFDEVLKNVNSDSFEWAIKNSIEESGIAEVPVNFVISNLDQLKSDLGMGDGVVSRAIDAAMSYDPANTDSKRYKESQEKTEVHYHVADMNEAIRLEKLRERKQMMKMK